ncbi:hypothetical protein Fmac_015332 [Flemingia macrophylla]|uniref:Uncharacterized protein n=1 Tax=Flemingia macrophylla TaxID=520843 RepID=A0ABD1MEB2_9FABA
MTTILASVLDRSNLEWMNIQRLMLQTPIADDHSSRDKALDREDDSQLLVVHLAQIISLLSLQETAASVLPITTILVSVLLHINLEWMGILRLMLQTPIADNHSSRYKKLDREDGSQLLAVYLVRIEAAIVARVRNIRSSNNHHSSVSSFFAATGSSAINDAVVIRGVHNVATDTSAETRKLEDKLDALVNLVTQLATNQKPASIARVCGIGSSNNHHSSVCPSSQQSGVDENPKAYAENTYSIPPQGVHDVATDTYAETRKLEGKLDAHVNLVTQLVASQKPASVARVWGIRSSNDHHTSAFSGRNDAIVIRGVHDVATDTSADTRKLEGKLDAIVILVIQLAANQKSAFVARVCGIRSSNDHHTSKLEGKLDALVNLVTQLATNQKPASIARVCDIRSSNDLHTSVYPSLLQSGVDEHPEAYAFSARNDVILIREVHDMDIDTSTKTRKLEDKLDAFVNLVTQLAANQKPASVARVCGINSSIDHHASMRIRSQPLLQEFGAYVLPMTTILVPVIFRINLERMSILRLMMQTTIADNHISRDKALDREDGSQLLALRIRSLPLLQESVTSVLPMTTIQVSVLLRNNLEWMSILRLMLQTPIADHHSSRDKALDREYGFQLQARAGGKLDAFLNLVTPLAMNQKPASVARVCGICSSNGHHTSVCPASQGVHDVATDTSAENRKLEGNLDTLVNLVTQLAAN